ncbi:hypothetical protein [Vibrio owensii]|uniref:hypothetical protein n=1 Tax=Vibrio owensii TaxID=696485 RepID=UPI0040694D4E
MKVQLPNGVILEGVPEGTSRDEIKETAIRNGLATAQDFPSVVQPKDGDRWANLASSVSSNTYDSDDWSGTIPEGSAEAAVADGALQGLTFGFADEALAALRSTLGDETYTEARDELRANSAQLKDDHPWVYGGSEVLGSLPLAARLPAAAWKAGGNVWGNLGRLGLEGAAYGGLYGLGTSEGETVGDIASDTGKSALIGGVTNPAVGAGLRGLGKVFTRDDRAVAANEAFGIDSTLAERYPNVGKLQNFLDTTSGGAAAASQRSKQYQNDAIDSLKDLADSGVGDAQNIGQRFIAAKNNWQKTNQDFYNKEFSELRKSINMEGKIVPTETTSFLATERGSFGGADDIANIVEIPSIKRLRKALEDESTVTVDTLWKLRQELGDSITTGKFGVDDISQAKAKQLYGAVSDDLYRAVNLHSDANTLNYFDTLNTSYRNFQETLDDIQPIFAKSNRTEHSPEKVTANLVKAYRDEPSTLEPLKAVVGIGKNDLIDEAGRGVLYQSALNRGEVDPQKALERYNIARSKSSDTDILDGIDTYNSFNVGGVLENTSPSRYLFGDNFDSVRDYERAMQLSRRSQDAIERGSAMEARQLVMSGAIPALAGVALGGATGGFLVPLAINATTYALRRGMSNEAASQFTDNLIRGIQNGSITAEQLRIFNTIMAADSEAFSEF